MDTEIIRYALWYCKSCVFFFFIIDLSKDQVKKEKKKFRCAEGQRLASKPGFTRFDSGHLSLAALVITAVP